MKSKYPGIRDTLSHALVLPSSLKGEKKFSSLLPILARLAPKGPMDWPQAITQLLKKDFQAAVYTTTHIPQAHCFLRPSQRSKHVFFSIRVNNKIARIFSCARIWLLKLCHYHIYLEISVIWPHSLSLWSSPNSHANLFSTGVQSCSSKEKSTCT